MELLGIADFFLKTRKQAYFLLRGLYLLWYNLEYRGKAQVNSNICVEMMVHLSIQIIGSLISLQTHLCAGIRDT